RVLSTSWPLSSSTRKRRSGSTDVTAPSISIASCFAIKFSFVWSLDIVRARQRLPRSPHASRVSVCCSPSDGSALLFTAHEKAPEARPTGRGDLQACGRLIERHVTRQAQPPPGSRAQGRRARLRADWLESGTGLW